VIVFMVHAGYMSPYSKRLHALFTTPTPLHLAIDNVQL